MNKRAQAALKTGVGCFTRDLNVPRTAQVLVCYASQNPGLDYRDYASGWNDANGRRAYFQESRQITKDWHRVCNAIRSCEHGVTDADVIEACQRAFSGRLQMEKHGNGYRVDYCTGQYWPTEYRKAVASVLESAAQIAYRRSQQAA